MRFIRRLWRVVKSRWMLRRLKGAARMAAQWELSSGKERSRLIHDIRTVAKLGRKQAVAQQKIEKVQRELEDAFKRFDLRLDERRRLDKEHEVVVDSLQTELTGYKESTIPFLTAQDELKLARIRAEIAVMTAKQALSTQREDIGG